MSQWAQVNFDHNLITCSDKKVYGEQNLIIYFQEIKLNKLNDDHC